MKNATCDRCGSDISEEDFIIKGDGVFCACGWNLRIGDTVYRDGDGVKVRRVRG